MTTAESFGPDSLFGVPLTTFPPGVPWKTTRDMLHDVFADMCNPWVQDYLLHTAPVTDAEVLADPTKRARAMPFTFEATSNEALSGGFSGTTVYLRLNVPVFANAGMGAGVAVETSFGTGGAGVVFPLDSLFVRYVVNSSSGAQLNLSFNERVGTIEATRLVHQPDGLWVSALLWFSPDLFMSAFDESYVVNFDKLESSLVRSIVSVVQHSAQSIATRAIVPSSYPYPVGDNEGEHFFKSVFCTYVGGSPMMSMPVFADGLWKYEMPLDSIARLTNWGVTDRLHRIKLSPHVPLPLETVQKRIDEPVMTLDVTAREDLLPAAIVFDQVIEAPTPAPVPAVVEDPFAEEDEFVRIRPKPMVCKTQTEEEMKEEEKKRKIELRKVKKREAAARNNARKRAEREREKARIKAVNA